MATIPTLETERLIFGPFNLADFEGLLDFYSEESTARFVGGVSSADDVWRRLALYIGHWQLRGYGFFALEDKHSGEFAGYCGPWYPHGWPEPEIGYGLLAPFQGRGLAFEAALKALSYAYDVLGWTTAISAIDRQNTASKHLAEKMGATFEEKRHVSFFEADIYRHLSPEDFRKHHSL